MKVSVILRASVVYLVSSLSISSAAHLPLFTSSNSTTTSTSTPPSSSSIRKLHTSLCTLLPILPFLSPPPNHTLLLTLATSAFKPLLFNWLCFVRYKAKWGHPPKNSPPLPHHDLFKLLVVTSDSALATELSDAGVVVWLLKGTDLDGLAGLDEEDWLYSTEFKDDLFFNLRLMDLLLPEFPPTNNPPAMHEWGTLHYQSLMLERSLVMSVLVGALAESQRIEPEDREKYKAEWDAKVAAHDWTTGKIYPEPFVGVKGVLLVDNDAVWLSSPSALLAHSYRPGGTHPAVIWSADSPPTLQNAWGGYSLPCACFFYSRTSDDLSHTASHLTPTNVDSYSPSRDAAKIWRRTAICHISMLLKSLNEGREQARFHETGERLGKMVRAVAPSFQGTSLGPAMFLSEQEVEVFPEIDHEGWLRALGSGDVDDVMDILNEMGIGDWDSEGEEEGEGAPTCLDLAKKNWNLSRNPSHSTPSTNPLAPPSTSPILNEPLPFLLFPPGMSYFAGIGGEQVEEGIKPCVIHANYATGVYKEKLLRERGLWALDRGTHEGEWVCDEEALREAGNA